MATITSCESHRGGVHIQVGGFQYRYDRKLKDGITEAYRCTEKLCRGRIFKNGDNIMVKCQHDHIPDPEELEVRRIMSLIRERARTTQDSSMDIIESFKAELSQAVLERFPPDTAIKRSIERIRKRLAEGPSISNQRHEQQQEGITKTEQQEYVAKILLPTQVYLVADNNQTSEPNNKESIEENGTNIVMNARKLRKLERQRQIEMNRQLYGKNRKSVNFQKKNVEHIKDSGKRVNANNAEGCWQPISQESNQINKTVINQDTCCCQRQQSMSFHEIENSDNTVTDKEAWAAVSRLMIYFNQDGYEDSPLDSLDECLKYIHSRLRKRAKK